MYRTKSQRSHIMKLYLTSILTAPIGLVACSDEGTFETDQKQQELAYNNSIQPQDPGPLQLCSNYPPCTALCLPLKIDPGPPGFCCNNSLRTTCYEAGMYAPGDKDNDKVPDNLDHCVFTADPTNANSDGDTWGDACDNCDHVSNQDQYDFDRDDIGNACDADLDGDGVDNQLDNCPDKANSDQANEDGDLHGDACDNCPKVHNDDQANSDQDSLGDACDWSGYRATQNSEAMMITSPYCSGAGYGTVDNCINEDAPLPPSIERGISTARDDLRLAPQFRLEIDDKVSGFHMIQPWSSFDPRDVPVPGQTQVLPFFRSSNDGRLLMEVLNDAYSFMVYRPELLGAFDRVLSPTRVHSTFWKGLQNDTIAGSTSTILKHATLCDKSGSGRAQGRELSNERNPRACLTSTGQSGDCYDVSWLGQTSESGQYDITSLAVTVFVSSPKTPNATIEASPNQELAVFPQGTLSPDLSQVVRGDVNYRLSRDKTSGDVYLTQHCACLTWPCLRHIGPPPQRLQHDFFEPTTSSDGRLLMVNMGGDKGIYYAIAPPALACKASGFKLFKPLSCLPSDPLAQDYGIAKNVAIDPSSMNKSFRDSKGNFITPGENMPGAYLWLDRKAKNLLYSQVNDYRDAWRAQQQNPPHAPITKGDGTGAPLSWENYPDQHPSASGNGVVALGAWTQGKIVVMDNVLNPTDWTGGEDENQYPNIVPKVRRPYSFKMPLYQEEPRWIRPGTTGVINSAENQFNYLDNQSPTSPFDVVWRVATNTNHNAEVIFDEYMLNNAFVVAHMNSPHTSFGNNPKFFPDDGFVPNYPANSMRGIYYDHNASMPEFRFSRNPRLQNAATSLPSRAPFSSAPPSVLRLRGGARVEPVALGGVRGKGVYLDGINDFIDMHFQNTNHQDWFYGLWLDHRDVSLLTTRTVFYWSDGSWVGLSGRQVVAYDRSTQTTKSLLLSKYTTPGEYFHLGVKLVDHSATNQRKLSFYINGTTLGTISFSGRQGFQMDSGELGGWSWFVVGDPGPAHLSPGYAGGRKPWKGWIDEFRIYALDQNATAHFEEFICNLAMGSLINDDGQAKCEQLNFHTQGHPVDVPAQTGLKCADKVHKNNTDPDCLRAQHLEIANLPLTAQQPRPSFLGNDFCTSCHLSNHPMIEMRLDALTAGTVNREDDMRRQPMDWPAYLGGQPYPGSSGVWPDIDRWIHTQGKVQ